MRTPTISETPLAIGRMLELAQQRQARQTKRRQFVDAWLWWLFLTVSIGTLLGAVGFVSGVLGRLLQLLFF